MIGRAGERAAGLIDSTTTIERQVVLAVIYGLAQFLLLVPGVTVGAPHQVVAAGALIALGTLAAFVVRWDLHDPNLAMIIPLLDVVAVGLLRTGTGGGASPFGALWILCAISLGAEPSRWACLLALPVTMGLTLLGAVQGATLTGAEGLRAVFLPLVLVTTALLVNELTRRLRGRLAMVEDLRRRQSNLLSLARTQAAGSAATSALVKETAAQLTSVIDAVTEQSIIGTDLSGRIDVFNAGAVKMLGYRAEDVIGRLYITDLHLADELDGSAPDHARDVDLPVTGRTADPGQLGALVAHARKGVPEVRTWTKLRADGTGVPAQVAITARRDAHGDIVGFLSVATDMTAALKQARLKDEFVNLISHELRTPLSSILGYLELVGDDLDNPLSEEQQRYLNTVERNANRLLRLVSDLLFTAQVESGGFHLTEQPVNVAGLIRASLDTAGPSAAARSVSLEINAPAEPVELLGDPTRLGQAVDNLLSNAVKFSRPGGSVVVELDVLHCQPDPSQVSISVRDTGIGIPPDELDRLFTRFFRATTARSEAVPGVGLGLTITRAIATAHGGTIELKSAVGAGTTFTIKLPQRLASQSRTQPVPIA